MSLHESPNSDFFNTKMCFSLMHRLRGIKESNRLHQTSVSLLGMFPGFDTDVSKSYFQAEQYNDWEVASHVKLLRFELQILQIN